MSRPKKHRVIVEITDRRGNLTEKQVISYVKDAAVRKLEEWEFENVQVKSLNRVIRAKLAHLIERGGNIFDTKNWW